MASVRFSCEAQFASGTGVKTLMQIVAAANVRFHIREIGYSFKGPSTDDANDLILCRQTTAGTSTAGTTTKLDLDATNAVQASFGYNFTAEPTMGVIYKAFYVGPGIPFVLPFERDEFLVKGSDRIALKHRTAPVNDRSVNVYLIGEE